MNMTPLLVLCALMISATQAFADAKITGSAKFQFSNQNTSVSFGCGGITNPSKENATGTLKVELWALDAPHAGGTISGIILGDYKLDGLNSGAGYTNVSKTLKAVVPKKRKAYYLCLTVLEYKRGAYVISDYRNFTGSTVLGPPASLFSMAGPWRWQSSPEGGTIDIEVGKISHTRTGVTGSLNLAVWATVRPYNGGNIQGFKLGEVKKEALQPGYTYTNVKNTAKYTRPPAGTYYVSIVLSEYDGGSYKIQAHLGSTTPSVFK